MFVAFFEYALIQSLGKDPVLMDFWNIEASPGASCFEHSLRILFGIPSGPAAFDGLCCFSSFSTPSDLIIIVGIVSLTCLLFLEVLYFCSLSNVYGFELAYQYFCFAFAAIY